MKTIPNNLRSWFQKTGMAEGVSLLLLLFVAMPLKYLAGKPEAVKYVGWVHGVLFIAFIATIAYLYFSKHLSFKKAVIAFIAAFLPFGTFIFNRWLAKGQSAEKLRPVQ